MVDFLLVLIECFSLAVMAATVLVLSSVILIKSCTGESCPRIDVVDMVHTGRVQ